MKAPSNCLRILGLYALMSNDEAKVPGPIDLLNGMVLPLQSCSSHSGADSFNCALLLQYSIFLSYSERKLLWTSSADKVSRTFSPAFVSSAFPATCPTKSGNFPPRNEIFWFQAEHVCRLGVVHSALHMQVHSPLPLEDSSTFLVCRTWSCLRRYVTSCAPKCQASAYSLQGRHLVTKQCSDLSGYARIPLRQDLIHPLSRGSGPESLTSNFQSMLLLWYCVRTWADIAPLLVQELNVKLVEAFAWACEVPLNSDCMRCWLDVWSDGHVPKLSNIHGNLIIPGKEHLVPRISFDPVVCKNFYVLLFLFSCLSTCNFPFFWRLSHLSVRH